jgi:MFS family permease
MATESTRDRLQPGDGSEDSTQRGCTVWLLLSCIILSFTTAFVFGWGLGAPNMYNSYTESFLKGADPCAIPANQSILPILNAENEASKSIDLDGDEMSMKKDSSQSIDDPTISQSKPKESFDFLTEFIKGIPQTIFIIGAFIGALTGPLWATYFDRKRTVFANYIFCFASSLSILLSYYKGIISLFYVGRFLLGYQGNRFHL